MGQYDEKVLARSIKEAAKGRLIWQKGEQFEYVSNGHWAVFTAKIEEIKVKVALYAAFGREIRIGETLTLAGGEVNSSAIDTTENFRLAVPEEPGVILPIELRPDADNGYFVRLINFGSDIAAIQSEYVDLVYTQTAYREQGDRKGLIFLGDAQEVAVLPVFNSDWRERIRKHVQLA